MAQAGIANHPGFWCGHCLELGQRLLRTKFLERAESGIAQQDRQNRECLRRHPGHAVVQPHAEIEGKGEQQQIDQCAVKRLDETPLHRHRLGFGPCVRAEMMQSLKGFAGRVRAEAGIVVACASHVIGALRAAQQPRDNVIVATSSCIAFARMHVPCGRAAA